MALLTPQDWQAQWITRPSTGPVPQARAFEDHPAPLFRKEFVLDQRIVRARAYVSDLGYYEPRLNGQRVGDHLLDPGWTTYSKRVLYSTNDVTAQLKRGKNAAEGGVTTLREHWEFSDKVKALAVPQGGLTDLTQPPERCGPGSVRRRQCRPGCF